MANLSEHLEPRDIAACYRRQGYPLAYFDSIAGAWAAMSQYGYALSFHPTRREARAAVVAFYMGRGWM